MGVKLREKKLSNGAVSYYLDINHEGRRWYEFLDIKAEGGKRSAEFVEKKKLAEKARSAKEYQLTVEKNHLPDEQKQEKDMLAFIREKMGGKRTKTPYEQLLKKLSDFIKKEEVLPMSRIDKSFLLRFQDFLKDEGLGQGTIYTIVHRFSTYIYKAVECGYMTANPYQKIPRSERVRLRRPTPAYLTIEEIEKLAQTTKGVRPQMRWAFFFSCFTGLRWSDCSRLKWSQIVKHKIEGQEVQVMRVNQMKTESSTYLPLSEQAILILQARKKDAEKEEASPYVFPQLYEPVGKSVKQSMAVRAMPIWGKKAGIEQKLYFHLSRHTFATLTLTEGADLYTVSKLLGHSDIKNTQIYAHVVNKLKVDAVARLPKFNMGTSNGLDRKAE